MGFYPAMHVHTYMFGRVPDVRKSILIKPVPLSEPERSVDVVDLLISFANGREQILGVFTTQHFKWKLY